MMTGEENADNTEQGTQSIHNKFARKTKNSKRCLSFTRFQCIIHFYQPRSSVLDFNIMQRADTLHL